MDWRSEVSKPRGNSMISSINFLLCHEMYVHFQFYMQFYMHAVMCACCVRAWYIPNEHSFLFGVLLCR